MNFYSWSYGLDGGAVSLEQHDKRFHPNGYKEGDECKFRDAHPDLVQWQKQDDNADDLNYSLNIVTPEEDKTYAEAASRGDKRTCMQMVRSLAKKKMPQTKVLDNDGNPTEVYHGSNSNAFNIFDTEKIGKNTGAGLWGRGFYFSTDREKAKEYGNERGFFVNLKNPMPIPTIKDVANKIQANSHSEYQNKFYKNLNHIIHKNNFDGVIAEGNEILIYSPSQIKSSEITYDDNGNLIPLSKRFDFNNPDIRY